MAMRREREDAPLAIALNPTLAAAVRAQAGVTWSRARALCTQGRVTVDGQRCLDPASRISADAVVVIDTYGPKLCVRPLTPKRTLAAQFRAHDIERIYHALAHGDVAESRIETYLTRDRGDGLRGSHERFRATRGEAPAGAKKSVTYVRPIALLAGATFIECRLETGRQHQIRIHLAELGHPLLGEHVYKRDYKTAMIRCPRIMLHASKLAFTHPRSRERVSFESVPPDDFQEMIESLRRPHGGRTA
jgi:23S rRNA pseudouridine1911/1915/1917 synthase